MLVGYEYISEIIDNLKRNRLRTFLTGFAVAWGIVFLVILLSVGVGLNRGISKGVSGGEVEPNYGIFVNVYRTSIPYKGYQAGRILYLNERQLVQLQKMLPAIEDITYILSMWADITYGPQADNGNVKGIGANYFGRFEPRVKMLVGRGINGNDVYNKEKVLLLSSSTALALFGSDRYEEALGKKVSFYGVSFTVVGVYEALQNNSSSYMPFSTAKVIFGSSSPRISGFYIYAPTIRSKESYEAFQKDILQALSAILIFSPDDENAMWGYSNYVNNETYNKAVNYFYLFLWIVGLSTLLIGIVGVSNIMLVTVRERYKEIGIRKAIGAKPRDILAMIMVESLLITAVAGAIGLVLAVGLVALGDYMVRAYHIGEFSIMGETIQLFDTPVLSPEMALGILIVMIIAGIIAGYTPARRAIRISAIEAMRD